MKQNGPFQIRLTATGFLNYVVGRRKAEIYALKTAPWEHSYAVYVNGVFFQSLEGAELVLDAGPGPIDAQRGEFAEGVPVQGDWTILDLIPSAADLCPGASLSARRDKRRSVLGKFTLANGKVTALPLDYTPRKIWSWRGAGGRPVSQVVSDAFLYESALLDTLPVLRVLDRKGQLRVEETLKPAAGGAIIHIALIAKPIGWPENPKKVDLYLLDISHLSASLSLCDIASETASWPVNPSHTPVQPKQMPKVKFPSTPHYRVLGIRQPGRPVCAGYVYYTK